MPISAVSGRAMERETVRKLQSMSGFVGIAAELVEYDAKFENIVYSLLGRVAVFEDLDTAVAAARSFRYGFICVTVQGDILRTSGAITGGSPEKGKRGGALSRTREIPELLRLITNGRKKAGAISAELDELKKQLAQEESTKAELADTIRELELFCASLGAELRSANALLDAAVLRDESIKAELDAQRRSLAESESAIDAL